MAKHPSEYATVPFGSMHVMPVDVGTVVTDERSGLSISIDDNTCAVKGSVIFCTERSYAALKARMQ